MAYFGDLGQPSALERPRDRWGRPAGHPQYGMEPPSDQRAGSPQLEGMPAPAESPFRTDGPRTNRPQPTEMPRQTMRDLGDPDSLRPRVYDQDRGAPRNRSMRDEFEPLPGEDPAMPAPDVLPEPSPPPVAPPPAAVDPQRQAAFEQWRQSTRGQEPRARIRDAYRTFLGRTPSQVEIQSHLNNPYGLESALEFIAFSPEADERPPTPPTAPGSSTGGTTPPRGNNPQSTDVWRYGSEGAPSINAEYFGGFDLQRDQNPNKSAKDRFAELSARSGVDPNTEFTGEGGKAAAEAWFRKHIMPGLIESGYEVLEVKGDQAYIKSWDGEGWTDFIVNAGGRPGEIRFAWQPQGSAGAERPTPRPSTPAPDDAPDEGQDDLGDPIYNDDGTVSFKMTPEAYRRLVAQRNTRSRVPAFADLGNPDLWRTEAS